jgi:hypothetical protein
MKRVLVFVSLVLACGLSAIAFPPVAAGAVSIIQHTTGYSTDHTGSTVTCALSATGASRNIIVGSASTTSAASAIFVSGISDNQGNVYQLASNSRGVYEYAETEVWHSLGAVGGVTSLTITFSGTPGYYRACFAYEVSGTLAFDSAAKVDSGTCLANVCTGASVTTATTTGFVLGIVLTDPIDQNPKTGNEFTSGGDIDGLRGYGAAASLISGTAAAHQPVWHNDRASQHFVSSTAAYRQ